MDCWGEFTARLRWRRAWMVLLPVWVIVFCSLFLAGPPRKEPSALSVSGPGTRTSVCAGDREEAGSISGESLEGASTAADHTLTGIYAFSGTGGGTNVEDVRSREEAGTGVDKNRTLMEDFLQPGDILLGRCRLSLVPSISPGRGWTHAAIYAGDGKIVVASNPLQDVLMTSVRSWEYPHMTWVTCLRVTSATPEERRKAAEFAKGKVGAPYDLNWFSAQEDGPSWYCSELVWAAYVQATDGRVNLEPGLGAFGVSPDDIYNHPQTAVVGGHYESKPDTIVSLLAKAFTLCAMFGTATVILGSRG